MKILTLTLNFIFFFQIALLSQPLEDSSYISPTMSPQTPTNLNYPEPKHVLVV